MVAELGKKPRAHAIGITVGDMCSTRVPGTFGLVYLVFNGIINVTSHDEQVAVFENAARHLEPGGVFVVEVSVPQLRRVPPGEPVGSPPWRPTTSASRRSTTSSARRRGPTTGGG